MRTNQQPWFQVFCKAGLFVLVLCISILMIAASKPPIVTPPRVSVSHPIYTSTPTPTSTPTRPAPTATPTNSPTPQAANLSAWSSRGASYAAGAVVVYQGELFQSKQNHLSQPGQAPPAAASLWQDKGACPGYQKLSGHVPAVEANATRVGPAPGGMTMHLALGLPMQNQDKIDAQIQQLYNPKSPTYRKFLTVEEFAQQYGAPPGSCETLASYAQTNGLTAKVHPNNLVVEVAGTAQQIEKAFSVEINNYKDAKGHRFFAPDREPSLPFTQVTVSHVGGLDNLAMAANLSLTPVPQIGSGPQGAYMGNDFRNAYLSCTSGTGSGQSAGVLAFDTYTSSDITAYQNKVHPGAPLVPVVNVPEAGFSNTPDGSNLTANISMSIETIISMAPSLKQVVVYEGYEQDTMLSSVATDPAHCNQIMCTSLFVNLDSTAMNLFDELAEQGQSFFMPSGDFGAFDQYEPNNEWIDDPYVTLVGGTVMTMSGNGAAYQSETAWVQSGGGIEPGISIPYYQEGDLNASLSGASTSYRNAPDVSASATNFFVIGTYPNPTSVGAQFTYQGTVGSAAIWTGWMAVQNQLAQAQGWQPLGFPNPFLYSQATSENYNDVFNDIKDGSTNGYNGSGYKTVPGFDLATGWGSPKCVSAASLTPTPVVSGCCQGTSWTEQTTAAAFSGRSSFGTANLNGRIWVIGGVDIHGNILNDVWSSPDGKTWTQATASAAFGQRTGFTTAAFNGKLWVMMGQNSSTHQYLQDIWWSTDGANWTQLISDTPFPTPRSGMQSVIYNNRLWIIGGPGAGGGTGAWSSADGSIWQPELSIPMDALEFVGAAQALNNNLYVMGASDGSLPSLQQSQVWVYNGTAWSEQVDVAPYGRRNGFATASYCGRLWLFGGQTIADPQEGTMVYMSDVWNSWDGQTWFPVTVTGPFIGARANDQALTFQNQMWILGGNAGVVDFYDDVWNTGCAATPVPTFTATATSTNTPSPTFTATVTPTFTYTFTPTSTPTATPTLAPNACVNFPDWSASGVAYALGQKVVYGTEIYQCLTPNTSQASWNPPAVPALWQDDGPCVGATPTPVLMSCAGVVSWSSNSVYYAVGSQVTYNGQLYQCILAHTSNVSWTPQAANTLWENLGACQ